MMLFSVNFEQHAYALLCYIGRMVMDDKFGYDIDDLSVDMSSVFSKTITEADIAMFAGVSGDTNPIHLDEDFAKETMFEGRIAHGMLCASMISTVIGTRLPGPGCVYMSQDLKFLSPVRIGDTVTARVVVASIDPPKRRLTLNTSCVVRKGHKVLEGQARIYIPQRQTQSELMAIAAE